uniref:Secreted protein n=1 Tax=Oryza glumipatula TaxID=40148 RepID=A0A0E0ARD0_9ORYZ
MVALRRGFKTLAVTRAVLLSAAGPPLCAASRRSWLRWRWRRVAVHDACVGGGIEVVAGETKEMWGGGICVGPTIGQ